MIKLVSDSTCDLSPALVQRCGVTILPLNIHLGEDAYEDGMNSAYRSWQINSCRSIDRVHRYGG